MNKQLQLLKATSKICIIIPILMLFIASILPEIFQEAYFVIAILITIIIAILVIASLINIIKLIWQEINQRSF